MVQLLLGNDHFLWHSLLVTKNSELRIIRNIGFLFSLTLVTVLGCSLKRGDPNNNSVGLTIQYNPPKDPPARLMGNNEIDSPFVALTFSTTPTPTPPSSISGFNCLVVNVVGNGIAPQKNFNLQNPKGIDGLVQGLLSGQTCSYPGVMSAPFSASSSSTQTLTVPSGSNRIIQVVGMQSDSGGYCTTGQFDGAVKTYAYEVGRGVVNLLKDTSVSISSSFSASTITNKSVACEGAGGGGSSFDPNSINDLTIWYQAGDYVDSSNTPLGTIAPNTNFNTAGIGGLRNRADPNHYGNIANSISNLGFIGTANTAWTSTGNFGSSTPYFNISSSNSSTSPGAANQVSLNKSITAANIANFYGGSTLNSFTLAIVVAVNANSLAPGTSIGILGMSTVGTPPFYSSSYNNYFFLRATGDAGVDNKYMLTAKNGATEVDLKPSTPTYHTSTEANPLIHYISKNGTSLSYEIIGGSGIVSANTTDTNALVVFSNSNPLRISIGDISTSGSFGYPFYGNFREFMFFKTALNSTQKNDLINSLKNRHGI